MNKFLRITHSQNVRLTYGFLGLALIMYSGFLIGPGLIAQSRNNNLPLSPIVIPEQPKNQPNKQILSGRPVRIDIPSIQVNIAVADGYHNAQNGKWTLSKDKAHFAVVSAEPNNDYGNTYIYGHNRRQVFARLNQLKIGDEVLILTNSKLIFTYKLQKISETKPNDVGVILPYSQKPTLSLQTCSGRWYENRQIYRFDFTSVEKQ